MTQSFSDPATPPDATALIPIVVGAHLLAERFDRRLAYQLQDEMRARLADSSTHTMEPLVCSDLWYLNDQTLRTRPSVAIGAPEVNAATAYLASRVPTSFVLEGQYRIQLDPEFIERRVCLWGTTTQATTDALGLFVERYLDDYLREVE